MKTNMKILLMIINVIVVVVIQVYHVVLLLTVPCLHVCLQLNQVSKPTEEASNSSMQDDNHPI